MRFTSFAIVWELPRDLLECYRRTCADYWLAVLPTSEEEAIEEHLFSCNECAARLREIMALGKASAPWAARDL